MTKQEALFFAIGQLEENQLQQSELTVHSFSYTMGEANIYQKKSKRRLLSYMIAAVLALSLLTATVLAAVDVPIFDSTKPIFDSTRQMVAALFGNETDHDDARWIIDDNDGNPYKEYHTDRAPVEGIVAETMGSLVNFVGKSITYAGHTLTVDTNVYDAASKCGVLTYSIENPEGLRSYCIRPNGQVYFPTGELFCTNQYGYSYIIEDKCTDTKLCAAFYYQIQNPKESDIKIHLTFWTAVEDYDAFIKLPAWKVRKYTNSPDAIVIPTTSDASLTAISFGNGSITVMPFAVQVDKAYYIREMKITYTDGTEYIIVDENTINYIFAVAGESDSNATYMMNRLVDVDSIKSIIVNGIEFMN